MNLFILNKAVEIDTLNHQRKKDIPIKIPRYFGYKTIHLDLQIWPQKMLK